MDGFVRACVCKPVEEELVNLACNHTEKNKKSRNHLCHFSCEHTQQKRHERDCKKTLARRFMSLFTHPPISMAKTRKFGQTIVFEMPLKRLREHERKSIYICIPYIEYVVLGRAAGFCAKLLSDAINVD